MVHFAARIDSEESGENDMAGTLLGSLLQGDPTIRGSILGVPYYCKPAYAPMVRKNRIMTPLTFFQAHSFDRQDVAVQDITVRKGHVPWNSCSSVRLFTAKHLYRFLAK